MFKTRKQRIEDRKKLLKLRKEIPIEYWNYVTYCGNCKYKKWTPLKKDYFVGNDIYVKTKRRKCYCSYIGKKATLDEPAFSDGLKICDINYIEEE